MDLEFSEDEAELRDNVRSVLDGICPRSVVRAVYERTGDAAAVWTKMVELDWPALGIAEAHGGLGMGFLELAIVAEELGRHGAEPLPRDRDPVRARGAGARFRRAARHLARPRGVG